MLLGIDNLSDCAAEGYRKFCRDPVGYTRDVVTDIFRDYWDLGLTAGGGYMLASGGVDNVERLVGTGLLAAGILSAYFMNGEENKLRVIRNLFGGVAGAGFAEGTSISIGAGMLGSLAAYFSDNLMYGERRKERP
jgi:hypothetical protein